MAASIPRRLSMGSAPARPTLDTVAEAAGVSRM